MKDKLKKVFENAVWWSGVVMVGLILGISLQFVRAWTEPTEAPPGGNVGAPINTSVLPQWKGLGGIGSLGVTGVLQSFMVLTDNFRMPTGAQPGYVLTADALGNATWQPPSGGSAAVPPGSQEFNTPGSFTWHSPAGVTKAYFTIIGGGGGGAYNGPAGTAGVVVAGDYIVTPNTDYAVIVGAGGPRGTDICGGERCGGGGGGNSRVNGVAEAAGGANPSGQYNSTTHGNGGAGGDCYSCDCQGDCGRFCPALCVGAPGEGGYVRIVW